MLLQVLQLAKMPGTALAIMAMLAIAIACAQEVVLSVNLESKTPPTFTFSGHSLATNFEILELPRTEPLSKIDPFSFKGETLWKISARGRLKAAQWPSVTYGEVPDGFAQTFPEHGRPTKLAEGKLYVAKIVGAEDSNTALFFVVRKEKPVNVTDEVFGP